jgi:hypothetical protein
LPKILAMTEKAVFIECEYPPAMGQNQEAETEKVAATICRPRCGYYRDAMLRNISIQCIHPKSPYYESLKEELAKQLAIATKK